MLFTLTTARKLNHLSALTKKTKVKKKKAKENLKMAMKLEISIGADGISIKTEDRSKTFRTWSKEFLCFDYNNWRIYVESDYLDCFEHFTLQFTEDGKILLSRGHCCDEEIEEEIEEEIDECCKYKNLEITSNYLIEEECFTIRLVKD